MARPVITEVTEIRGLGINNIYTDGTIDEHVFYEGDIIEDFKFAFNNEYTRMTCKLSKVNFNTKRFPTKKNASEITTTRLLGSVSSIVVDGSEQYNANLKGVEVSSILEYDADETKEVKSVSCFPMLKVNLKVTLSDESYTEAVLYEGMILNNVTIQLNGNDVKGNFKLVSFIYELVGSTVKLTGMYLKGDAGDFKVSFFDIKKVGTESVVISNASDFSSAFNDALSNGTGLSLGEMTITDQISVSSSLSLTGNKMNIPANKGERRTDEINEDETVFSGAISLSNNSDVTISGITFTESAKVNLKGAKSLTLKNCKFTNLSPESGKTYLFVDSTPNTDGILLQVDGCYFGTNTPDETGNMYNLFEINTKIKDGSYVRNCYFAAEVCTHNVINLYNTFDNSTITIENNHFEKSINACRVGFKGAPEDVKVILKNNTYDETDTNPDYAGLLIVQPYGRETTSFAGVTIELIKNKFNNISGSANDQLWYIWTNPTDTQITDELAPTVFVDGVKVDPIYPQN